MTRRSVGQVLHRGVLVAPQIAHGLSRFFAALFFLAGAGGRTGSLKPHWWDGGAARWTWLRGLRWKWGDWGLEKMWELQGFDPPTTDSGATEGEDERTLSRGTSSPRSSLPAPPPPAAMSPVAMVAADPPPPVIGTNPGSCGSSEADLAVSSGGERRSCSCIAMESKDMAALGRSRSWWLGNGGCDGNGKEIKLNPGKTWILIVLDNYADETEIR